MPLDPRIAAVTDRIRERSRASRAAYLAAIEATGGRGPNRAHLTCANIAHVSAAAGKDKERLKREPTPNLAIVTAYNDMLSAHRPYESYPEFIRQHARALGATAQVAGGVPAMCDGVTQGRPGMDLSLFSRDVIAQATAIALTHDAFDCAVYLGICDKIVPGQLIGALAFGHLPALFVPGGPMPSGIPNKQKAAIRERYAAGEATREELLEAESAAYHAPGTCTFYGTANSNQVLLEAMGLQLPGSSFVQPGTPLRAAFTRAAVERALRITALGADYRPIGRLVDERAMVNAMVALCATGGSTNHTIHFVAVARAAGIIMTWDDIDAIAHAVPLLARVYPNGEADVNGYTEVGGNAFVFRELLDAGLMHDDIPTVVPGGMRAYADTPMLDGGVSDEGRLAYAPAPTASGDESVLRPVANPFEAHGGLRLVNGNLGRGLIKLSAIKPEFRSITAPAVVVDNPQALNKLHAAGALPQDFVAVVRFQGPHANGMPEMHSLTPLLGMLQNQGRRVALVTDGRLSGASGKIPSAIHVTPEALRGGTLAKLREGDIIRLDGEAGVLEALVDPAEWNARTPARDTTPPAWDLGRNLFAVNRMVATPADEGALSISCGAPVHPPGHAPEEDTEYELGSGPEAAQAPHQYRDQ
jgi:phosphogluconate dehydratase